MIKRYRDFTLGEALSDPLILTMMAADGVNPRKLERSLMAIAATIEGRSPAPEPERRPSSSATGIADARATIFPAQCC
jgi:hypothetical protein